MYDAPHPPTHPQNAVSKLRKEKAALDSFIKELEDKVEHGDTASATQAELRAKREAELASLKQKYDQAVQDHDNIVQDLKRKSQAQVVRVCVSTGHVSRTL